MKKSFHLCCFLLLFYLFNSVCWAGYGDFLIRNDISVIYKNNRPEIIQQGHSGKPSESSVEGYWAQDYPGNRYQLRLTDPLSNFAEIGSSMMMQEAGLPSLPVYPILLKRGHHGVPSVKEAQALDQKDRSLGVVGGEGEWFQGTVQSPIHLRSFDVKELTGEQLSELMGQLLINYTIGNDNPKIHFQTEPSDQIGIGFDGKHFYTLHPGQSFQSYLSATHTHVSEALRGLEARFPDLFKNLGSSRTEALIQNLNAFITRLEKIHLQEPNPAFESYFSGKNALQQSQALPPLDYLAELRRRIQGLRSELITHLQKVGIPSSSLIALKSPSPEASGPLPVEFPHFSFNNYAKDHPSTPGSAESKVPLPSALEHTSEELLWGYYFETQPKSRLEAEKVWGEQLKIPPPEVIDTLVSLKPRKRVWNEFQLDHEFPNYYLQSRHSPEQVQEALAKAMKNILYRIEIPYEKGNQIHRKGFFQYLIESKNLIDPRATLYVSGGVVRSILGYLYKYVYNKKQKKPEKDAWDILNDFSESHSPLDPTQILGVGSDLDILTTSSQESERTEELNEFIRNRVNSARKLLKLDQDRDPVINTAMPLADVNSYSVQINRSLENGGSTLDFLAFELEKNEFKEPDSLPGIVKKYIQGEIDYLPGTKRESPTTTIIRAIRPLLELLFVKYAPTGEKYLIDDLNEMIKQVQLGHSLSQDTMVQFQKATRNAREWGGHNRLFESQDRVEIKVRELIKELGTMGDKRLLVIPRFTSRIKPSQKRLTRTLPSSLLMSPELFVKKYTLEGRLFHGTPKREYILGMIRNGFVRSGKGEGAASYGSGTYTTTQFQTASGYCDTSGCVVPIALREDVKPKILNWSEVENNPVIKKIIKEAKEAGVDEFTYLAQEYGIDIIVNTHVIVQNTGVLKLPKNLGDLIRTQYEVILSKTLQAIKENRNKRVYNAENQTMIDLEKDLNQYIGLYQLAQAVKIEGVHSPLDLIETVVAEWDPPFSKTYQDQLHSRDPKILQNLFESWMDSPSLTAKQLILPYTYLYPLASPIALFRKSLTSKDSEIKRVLISQVSSPDAAKMIREALHSSDETIQRLGSGQIRFYNGQDKLSLILQALDHSNPQVHLDGCFAISGYTGPDKSYLVKKLFQDRELEGRQTGLSIILSSDDPENIQLLDDFFQAQEPISFEDLNNNFKNTIKYQINQKDMNVQKLLSMIDHKNPKISRIFLSNIDSFNWRHSQAKLMMKHLYDIYKSGKVNGFDFMEMLSKEGLGKPYEMAFEVMDRSDQIEALLVAYDLNKNKSNELMKFMQTKFLSPWRRAIFYLNNLSDPPLPVAEYEKKVKDVFLELGLHPEFWTRRKRLFRHGRMEAPDAFDSKYFQETASLLAENVKYELERWSDDRKPFQVVFKKALPFKKELFNTPEFKDLIQGQISLFQNSTFIRDYRNLFYLEDYSEPTWKMAIHLFKNPPSNPPLTENELLEFCRYFKKGAKPSSQEFIQEIDDRLITMSYDRYGLQNLIKNMDRSSCSFDLPKTRAMLRKTWKESLETSPISQDKFRDVMQEFISISEPDSWEEEIRWLEDFFVSKIQGDHDLVNSNLYLYSLVNRANPALQKRFHRILQIMKANFDSELPQKRFFLNDLKMTASDLLELSSFTYTWKKERDIVNQRFLSRLKLGKLLPQYLAALGKLLEFDLDDRENLENYQNLRETVHPALEDPELSIRDWDNISSFALESPLAENWTEAHQELRNKLSELLVNEKEVETRHWAALTRSVLSSRPAASWKKERQRLRKFIPAMFRAQLDNEELESIVELINRDPDDPEFETYKTLLDSDLRKQYPYSGISAKLILELNELYHPGRPLEKSEDFEVLKKELHDLINSNDVFKWNAAGKCFVKDRWLNPFREEAHQWLLKATPAQLVKFVLHNDLHDPKNDYILTAAKIMDPEARRKFLDARQCAVIPSLPTLKKALDRLDQPQLSCPK